jgi:hypothetical protein
MNVDYSPAWDTRRPRHTLLTLQPPAAAFDHLQRVLPLEITHLLLGERPRSLARSTQRERDGDQIGHDSDPGNHAGREAASLARDEQQGANRLSALHERNAQG